MHKISLTLTGADEQTDLDPLRHYQGVEIGLLYSANPEGPRYPRLEWLYEAARYLPHVALHVCGRQGRENLASGLLDPLVELVERIQLNGAVSTQQLSVVCRRYPEHTVITQAHLGNTELLAFEPSSAHNHAVLLDSSGGRGRLPTAWYRPLTDKPVGFAGGLSWENLPRELPRIMHVVREALGLEATYWIDMESSLRTEDRFDVNIANLTVETFRGLNHVLSGSIRDPLRHLPAAVQP